MNSETPPAIRAVVFDLGSVLIGVDESLSTRAWADAASLPLEHVEKVYRDDMTYHRLECGELTIEDHHRQIASGLGSPIAFDDFLAGWNSVLLPPLPGAAELTAALAKSLRLVLLTNTNHAHADVWRAYCADLLSPFECVFCSHEMGLRKPDPAIYRRVIDYLDLPADAVAFVDDRADNVAAANGAGLRGIVHTDIPQTTSRLREMGVEIN